MCRVSIITVVRNAENTIEDAILSVINQDYTDFEYILVDGKSDDNTVMILQKYSHKIKFISEKDCGIYDAMNKGISLSNGKWIYFLGSDDILYSNKILTEIFSISDIENYDVVYGNVFLKQSKIEFAGEFNFNKLALMSLCHQSMFYKKSLFNKFGYFNTKYRNAADYVFNIQLFCTENVYWKYVNKIIAVYNEDGTSASRPDINFLNDAFKIKFDYFQNKVDHYVLTRIFYSTFFNFSKNHNLITTAFYFNKVLKKVGLFHFLRNLFIIVKSKILITKS